VDVVQDGDHVKFSNTIGEMLASGTSFSLRFATAVDAGALLALGADADVTRFFSWGPYTSIQEPVNYIAGLAGERESGERLDFLIVDGRDRVLGVTGLSEFSWRDRRAVVGTWLGRAYWGSGANRGAKALIAALAFRALGIERLGAYADLDNPRSQAALERIGFQREGVLRHWHRHGETVHDVIGYSWLRPEWEQSELAREEIEIVGPVPAMFRCVSSVAVPS
jgi:N-acetyltransferase